MITKGDGKPNGGGLRVLDHSTTPKCRFATERSTLNVKSRSIDLQSRKLKRISLGQVYSAPALEKGINILELLSEIPSGLSISEIARRLKRSIGAVFRVIVVMEERGWLRKDLTTDRYSIAYHVLGLAVRASSGRTLSAIAAPRMSDLSVLTRQSCHLVIRVGDLGFVLHNQDSAASHESFTLRLGAAVDLQNSCSGHVLMAFGAVDGFAPTSSQVPRPPADSSSSREKIFARVRRQGYETQQNARVCGVTDISFPIFELDGRIAAALTVPYLCTDEISQPSLPRTRQLLREASRDISKGLTRSAQPLASRACS